MKSAQAIFVDTWGWLAYGHRRDGHHQEVRGIFTDLTSMEESRK